MYIITYSILLQSLYSNSFSFFSNLIVVRAATSMHISLESLPTSSHNVLTSYPSPIRSAATLRGPMNGPRRDQRFCAVSKKISMPTSPRPLIFFRALGCWSARSLNQRPGCWGHRLFSSQQYYRNSPRILHAKVRLWASASHKWTINSLKVSRWTCSAEHSTAEHFRLVGGKRLGSGYDNLLSLSQTYSPSSPMKVAVFSR
jgi:hypothetical protein